MSMPLAIAATLAVATPSLILNPQLAQAQQVKHIQGLGFVGQVNCPAGSSPPGNEEIFFRTDKSRGNLFGDWRIAENITLSFQFIAGDITGGHISGKQFTLTGTEDRDDLCSSQMPATITITGRCGQGVTIQFRASNGQEGEFVGTVACAK
jgi:hypothetical protein